MMDTDRHRKIPFRGHITQLCYEAILSWERANLSSKEVAAWTQKLYIGIETLP